MRSSIAIIKLLLAIASEYNLTTTCTAGVLQNKSNLVFGADDVLRLSNTAPTKATTKATEATSKSCESDKEATKQAQTGMNRRNYQ